MKKLYILAVIFLFSVNTFAQSDSKIWIGIDGSYWQKSVIGISSPENSEYSGNIRPMIGYKLNDKWSLGIMTNFQSYSQDESIISYQPFNFLSGGGDDQFSIRYGTKNNIFGLGAFIRRELIISEKISFNFSLYSMRESGNDGSIFQDYNFAPCPNCLSIALPLRVPFSELNWRTGLDLAFAYQVNDWLKMELRANLLELRLQEISDPKPESNNNILVPSEGSLRAFYGNFTDFGSAVSRDGIRFGLIFTPF
jgi:hypothetical protein